MPCTDFSPWLGERVRLHDVEAVGEFLWRIRQANPGSARARSELRARYRALARAILEAPIERTLGRPTPLAMRELRVALVLLAAHEGFSGFIMTGEARRVRGLGAGAARLRAGGLRGADGRPQRLRHARWPKEMSYWAAWPVLHGRHPAAA